MEYISTANRSQLEFICLEDLIEKENPDSIDKPYYDRMHARLQTAKAKRMKKLRSSTVDPVPGTLINFMGMRRVWTRGIAGAGKFMPGAATAYNLKKWLNDTARKVKTGAMVRLREGLQQTATGIIQPFLVRHAPCFLLNEK